MRDIEHKQQVTLMRWMELQFPKQYALTYAIPNGGHRHIAVARKLKAEGVKSGVPDLCIAWPGGGYHGLYIEYKTETGKATQSQRSWIKALSEKGYRAEVCKGVDQAIRVITEYLKQG